MVPMTSPLLAALVLMIAATFVGMLPVVKLIRVYEGHHELKQGSAGWIRTIAGWSMIVFWLMTTWFVATIIGDWGVSGDLQGAVDRSWLRLRIIIEIAAAIADSD
jgi:hypothetical protein